MSQRDLESGVRWSEQLAAQLQKAEFGILCLTPDNLRNDWVLFEAGAISRDLGGRVCGLLFNGLDHRIIRGPLSQFQNRIFSRAEFYTLVQDINKAHPCPLPVDRLGLLFRKFWPNIEKGCRAAIIKAAPDGHPAPPIDQEVALLKKKVASLEKICTDLVESVRPALSARATKSRRR
jgi:hypothetical protein